MRTTPSPELVVNILRLRNAVMPIHHPSGAVRNSFWPIQVVRYSCAPHYQPRSVYNQFAGCAGRGKVAMDRWRL